MDKDCRYCKHFPLLVERLLNDKDLMEDPEKREALWEQTPCGSPDGPCEQRRFEPAA